MENLLLLLNKISEISPLGVFNQDVIVVQNAGMQHWLNLALASERGISMNMRYALPAQFLWKLMRTLASEGKVPEQSPYSREVLSWRIYAILGVDSVISSDDFLPATRYWMPESDSIAATDIPNKQALLKRYQLARQMADLYEQYLIFRPQWLDAWQQGNFVIEGADALSSKEHKWQGRLWQLLTEELPYNPVELMQDAIANMADKKASIPQRISFFGLNTMAPMWLDFINALSEHVEVHFFHLNPCFSYWGDIVSEKQALAKLSHWSDNIDDEQVFIGNPILANLGQQGREFLNLIQEYSTIDIDLFEEAHLLQANGTQLVDGENPPVSTLHQLQNDILTLTDPRGTSSANQSDRDIYDDSIVINSAHSALREVQGLHDYLLHQFNDDPELTPKDILVMCPQIEQYAPYVNAVFTRGWQDVGDDVPPLPCSIADRSAKDSDPLVAAFVELLALPDSRFGVSQILSLLRLPAIGEKFAIAPDDLDKITLWLSQACVHWGIDIEHKQHFIGERASNSFTWQQGLSRLLRGFSFNDCEQIYQDQLLLSNVEGDDAILLGQLMLFIEQLQFFTLELNKPRSSVQWQHFLLNQLEQLFTRVDDNVINSETSLAIVEQAIANLVEHCQHAHFEALVPLTIIVDYLNNHFSQGDASKQFMVGQVTFCSMLPMRSIPFKVIAVLGLNDGEFPRQRQPLGFDLMSLTPMKLGDRSRRGDDRYLFLEAIISARKSLYLSYQGRNIKNNNERQPSIVLKELMDYLQQGYGWQFSQSEKSCGLNQLPMQAFSEDNYKGRWPSFDARWLALGQSKFASNELASNVKNADTITDEDLSQGLVNKNLASELENDLVVSTMTLLRFFQHPSRMFAQQNLNLYFDNAMVMLDDVEPFNFDRLQSYLVRQQLLDASLAERGSTELSAEASKELTLTDKLATTEDVIQRAQLTGQFPDLPTTEDILHDYQKDSVTFSTEITKQGVDNPTPVDCQVVLTVELAHTTKPFNIELNAQLMVKDNKLVHYRCSSAKAKDLFTLYLQQLVLQVWQEQNQATASLSEDKKSLLTVDDNIGIYFNTKSQKVEQYRVTRVVEPLAQLTTLLELYIMGQQQPLLINGDLAAAVFTKKRGQVEPFGQMQFSHFWQGDLNVQGFGDDPYIKYFWPSCPQFCDIDTPINAIYQHLYFVVNKVAAARKSAKGAKS
jgi:exodeoxyribonuclease V gamma subunit